MHNAAEQHRFDVIVIVLLLSMVLMDLLATSTGRSEIYRARAGVVRHSVAPAFRPLPSR
jgi:hypothetical protein